LVYDPVSHNKERFVSDQDPNNLHESPGMDMNPPKGPDNLSRPPTEQAADSFSTDQPHPSFRRYLGWPAWLAITIVVLLTTLLQLQASFDPVFTAMSQSRGEPPAQAVPQGGDAVLELQARLIYGVANVMPTAVGPHLAEMYGYATTPDMTRRLAAYRASIPQQADGSPGDGEVQAALTMIQGIPEADVEQDLDPLLQRAIAEETSLTDDERDRLEQELGWYGRILVLRNMPADDAEKIAAIERSKRPVWAAFGIGVAGVVAAFAGFVLLVIAIAAYMGGKLKMHMAPPQAGGAIYAQAFAIYLGIYLIGTQGLILGLHALNQLDPDAFLPRIGLNETVLGMIGLVLASALGVMWPVLRGVPGRVSCEDLGLHRGRGFITEVGAGILGYMAVLPLFVFGVIAAMVFGFGLEVANDVIIDGMGLDRVDSPPALVTHPVVTWIRDGDVTTRVLVFGLAAMFAPFFEELMFRGALLTSVRRRFGFVAASLFMAFIFAIIHPQGLATVPALMSLAFGFALLRAWRGSLIAPMTAHALHNGTLVALQITIFTS
jgi:membrane protease YdiL (CAAX protease family)